ncbi:MAG: transcription termination/antitermination NusG family protein [Terracidiphilus sp.]|jgi:transcription antitermination factor NusG
MFDSPWRVLHVVANHEKRVARHLTARSLEHYLPLYAVRSKWTDRVVDLERPLFAGYVFVRFPREERISVVSAPGVLRLLGSGVGETVSAAEIERIREGLASGYILRPHPTVSVGELVRVHRGVFAGVEGVVTELRHQCKVIIALAATRQCFSLEMDLDDIEVLRKPVAKEVVAAGRKSAVTRS